MQRDMHGMNRTISSGPFGMMNDVMPFTSDTNVPPSIAPQPVWPSYNPAPQYSYANPYARPQAAPRITPQVKTKVAPKTKPLKQAVDKKSGAQKNPAQKNRGQNVLKTKEDMPGASPLSLKETSIKGR